MSKKPDYGIDAPNVIRNLMLVGCISLPIGIFIPAFTIGELTFHIRSMMFMIAAGFIGEAILMIVYVKFGKFRHRDRMLSLIAWRGNETVLDVGTGRGLLMIGAAKKLTSGKSIGIDIWNKEDLSDNTYENAAANAAMEGVKEKIEIKNENARAMSFADNTFDVILSNLCLHNIYNKEERKKACMEIVRVLKPGGTAVISDYKLTAEYARLFKESGLEVALSYRAWMDTFPPLRIVTAKKKIA